MQPRPAITIWREFPYLDARFLHAFWHDNLIVHAHATLVAYDEHPGPLSIKCAFGGAETYVVDRARLTVDDATYLVLNHGRPYASFIHAARPVESLSIFFRAGFVDGVLGTLLTREDKLLDDPHGCARPVAFYERRTPHDRRLSPSLRALRRALCAGSGVAAEPIALDELFHRLAAGVLAAHRGALREAARLPAVRASTRAELYRRVVRARDVIDSDPQARHRLDELARVACLAPHHFLRRFRDAFGLTPHRYVLWARRRNTQFFAS
jgi:AraC family transcriptional regulator